MTQSNYQPCVNRTNPLELRTGTASANVPGVSLACTNLAGSNAGTRYIHWSTGTTSTFSYIATTEYLAGGAAQVTREGSITAGEFQGATAVDAVVFAGSAFANCSTTGVTSLSGVSTLTLVQ